MWALNSSYFDCSWFWFYRKFGWLTINKNHILLLICYTVLLQLALEKGSFYVVFSFDNENTKNNCPARLSFKFFWRVIAHLPQHILDRGQDDIYVNESDSIHEQKHRSNHSKQSTLPDHYCSIPSE